MHAYMVFLHQTHYRSIFVLARTKGRVTNISSKFLRKVVAMHMGNGYIVYIVTNDLNLENCHFKYIEGNME